jgi:hypothetical protein
MALQIVLISMVNFDKDVFACYTSIKSTVYIDNGKPFVRMGHKAIGPNNLHQFDGEA